jgi:hypothetical protein
MGKNIRNGKTPYSLLFVVLNHIRGEYNLKVLSIASDHMPNVVPAITKGSTK